MNIQNDLKRLEEAREERAHSIVKIHLEACLARVNDIHEALDFIIENGKSQRGIETRLREAVSAEVVEAAQGLITVVEYAQKMMSKQSLMVYVGTHWVRIRTQVFYDFVKDCAMKTGLGTAYVEQPDFMNKLFEQVAFRVARDRELFVPKGQVWINMQNGTLEVHDDGTIRLRTHDKEDFFTYVLPYSYDPSARCDRWHAFLDRVMPEVAMQMAFGEYISSCLVPDMKLEKWAALYGKGANGKSVATDVITELMGRENVSHVDLEKLTQDDNQRSMCEGKLANISQENGPNVNYSVLKSYVSGEPLIVKRLYKDPAPMTHYGRLIASYNILPKAENTHGNHRRWLLFPFDVTIPEAERDIHLKDRLCEELPGILNWVLECLQRLIENKGFTESLGCKEALRKYVVNSNSALRFLEERCVEDETGSFRLKDLYPEYLNFCHEEGVTNRFGRNSFGEQLENAGIRKHERAAGKVFYLKLKGE